MSLTKLLKAPMNLFKKEVITFVIIRRHDKDDYDNKLRYISVKPSASIATLRRKIWHLLDLPDYCDELIILKAGDVEISMNELRKGNDPQKPYILEVWPPRQVSSSVMYNNMITMGGKCQGKLTATEASFGDKIQQRSNDQNVNDDTISCTTFSKFDSESINFNRLNAPNVQRLNNLILTEERNSELSSKVSNSSIFFKMHGKKSRDNFVSILMKIQSDLCVLTNKLSTLENKVNL